jgi:hypothetical protein
MRILIATLLVTPMLFAASQAGALGFTHEIRGGAPSSFAPSDTIVVDVFLDADQPNLNLASIAVLTTPGISYDAAASLALPVVHPAPSYGTTGAQPGYILYSPGSGMSPATAMYPVQTPTWQTFPLDTPEQVEGWATQVNVNYAEASLAGTVAIETHVWIASLVYHVDTALDATIALKFTSSNPFEACCNLDLIDAATLSDPIYISAPEPGTLALIGLGSLVLAIAGRKKA